MSRTAFLAFTGAFVCLANGCVAPLSSEQQELLRSGEDAFARQKYDESVKQMSAFVQQVPDHPQTGRARYVRAMGLAKTGRSRDAYDDLRAAISTQNNPDVVWRAYLMLSTLQFEDEQWDAAGRSIQAAMARAPRDEPIDGYLFRLGVCYERTGRWEEARAQFQEMLKRYPESRFAKDARRRVALNARHFAVQCGAFSTSRNAEALADTLARQNLPSYARAEQRETGVMYIALVGQYGSYAEAQKALQRVRGTVPQAVLWP